MIDSDRLLRFALLRLNSDRGFWIIAKGFLGSSLVACFYSDKGLEVC